MWQPLKKGDLVDVVAPGFRVSESHLQGAIRFLHEIGLQARVPRDIFGDDIVCGQVDKIRLAHLKSAILAKDSQAIWCLRGGYGAIRLIDAIAKIKKPRRPKLFIGYSDAVTLHNFFNRFWKWPTLHGPLLDRLGQHTLPEENVDELLDLVFGRRKEIIHKNLLPLNLSARKRVARKENAGSINGKVYGGNLTVVQSVLGTRYAKIPQDAILFFEDIGERGYRIDRILVQLRQAGYFARTKAIVFGQFTECLEKSGEDRVPGVIQRFADEMKIPVFKNLQVGHGNLQRAVPMGTPARIVCVDRQSVDLNIRAGFGS